MYHDVAAGFFFVFVRLPFTVHESKCNTSTILWALGIINFPLDSPVCCARCIPFRSVPFEKLKIFAWQTKNGPFRMLNKSTAKIKFSVWSSGPCRHFWTHSGTLLRATFFIRMEFLCSPFFGKSLFFSSVFSLCIL